LATLEIDLMMLVHRMSMEKEPHVAIFAPYLEASPMERQIAEMMRRPLPPSRDLYASVGRLLREEGYRVTRIRLNSLETIPEDADALLVFTPQDLNERQKHEINRFLRSGKSVLYGVQTHAFKFSATRRGEVVAAASKAENFGGDLLKAWGVEVDERILMDKSRFQLQLQMQSDFPVAVPISFANQIEVLEDTINSEHPITQRLSAIFYLWGCALKPDSDRIVKQGLRQTVLLRSSPQTWFVDADRPRLDETTKEAPELKYSGTQTLAVLLEGVFADATEGKPVPPWPDDTQGKPEAAKPLDAKPGRLLLIGGGEIFSDQLLDLTSSTRHQNVLFTMNAVEALALTAKLSSIRAKSFKARFIPMAKLANKFWNFVLGGLVLPLILAIFGVLGLLYRRRRRDEYRRSLEVAKP
ncbi:MAG TPA: Gldg family protein, partial [Planctomycetota bacterium]|nr:Gldg family protein [Planctomycetota bacterium]